MVYLAKLCKVETILKEREVAFLSPSNMPLGVIQQLRGQEEGEGGSAKSPRLSTQGVSGCPRGQKFEKKV